MRLNAFLGLGRALARVPEGSTIDTDQLRRDLNVPQASISTATFYNWLSHLEFQRAISRTRSGVTVDRRRLMNFYAAFRVTRARPVLTTTSALSGADLVRHLQGEGIPTVALGFLSAANEWAFFEPRRSTQLYVGDHPLGALRDAIPPGDRPVEVFRENWSEVPVRNRAVPVTDLFMTIVDCHAHPEGGAHAAFLERELLWGRE